MIKASIIGATGYTGRELIRLLSGDFRLKNIDVYKDVIGTNLCLINVAQNKEKAIITSAIDNLIRGASGQAVWNMNIMFGIREKEGL